MSTCVPSIGGVRSGRASASTGSTAAQWVERLTTETANNQAMRFIRSLILIRRAYRHAELTRLNQACLSRHVNRIAAVGARFGRRLHTVVTIFSTRLIAEAGVGQLLPRCLFARVTRSSAHHPDHCALDHVIAVVDRITGSDTSEKFVVLN